MTDETIPSYVVKYIRNMCIISKSRDIPLIEIFSLSSLVSLVFSLSPFYFFFKLRNGNLSSCGCRNARTHAASSWTTWCNAMHSKDFSTSLRPSSSPVGPFVGSCDASCGDVAPALCPLSPAPPFRHRRSAAHSTSIFIASMKRNSEGRISPREDAHCTAGVSFPSSVAQHSPNLTVQWYSTS